MADEKTGFAYQREENQYTIAINTIEEIRLLFDPQNIQLIIDLSDMLQPISESETEEDEEDELTNDEENEQTNNNDENVEEHDF